LPALLELLPQLRVAVLAGRPARAAAPVIEGWRPDLPVLLMPHPSPTIVCTSPAIPEQIMATLTDAARLVSAEQPRAGPP
jgi:uracil-DNA glycosylase